MLLASADIRHLMVNQESFAFNILNSVLEIYPDTPLEFHQHLQQPTQLLRDLAHTNDGSDQQPPTLFHGFERFYTLGTDMLRPALVPPAIRSALDLVMTDRSMTEEGLADLFAQSLRVALGMTEDSNVSMGTPLQAMIYFRDYLIEHEIGGADALRYLRLCPPSHPNNGFFINNCVEIGGNLMKSEDRPGAILFYEYALTHIQEDDQISSQSGSIRYIAAPLHRAGEVDRALELYQQALETAELITDPFEKAGSLRNLGSDLLEHDFTEFGLQTLATAEGIAKKLKGSFRKNRLDLIHSTYKKHGLAREARRVGLLLKGSKNKISKTEVR